MTVRRVTETYAKGALAGARRSPSVAGARSAAPTQAGLPGADTPKTAKGLGAAVSETVMAALATDIATFQAGRASGTDLPSPPAAAKPALPQIEIPNIAADLARLAAATHLPVPPADPAPRARTKPVSQSHAAIAADPAADRTRPGPADDAGSATRNGVPPAPEQPIHVAAQTLEPVVIPRARRTRPAVKHVNGGVMRLFAMVALVCTGIGLYWLFADRPEIKSAVAYLPKLPASPAESAAERPETAPEANPADGKTVAAAPADTPAKAETSVSSALGDADTIKTAQALAANPLLNLKVECGGLPCGSGYVGAAPAQTTDGATWVSSYGTMKPPASSDPPEGQVSGTPPPEETPKAGRNGAASGAVRVYDSGMEKSKSGDSEGAIRDFSEAIRLDPNYVDAYVQRGNARFKNGNPDLAIADFRDAIRVDARNATAFKARGMARLYNGDEDGALDDLTKAIQIAESEATRLPVLDLFFARRTRAGIHARKQAGDRELFDLSAMIDAYWKNPGLADALKVNYGVQGATALMATIYRQRAALYVQRANTDGAIADLSLALQLDPARAIQLVLERARVQEAAGRREQAAADFKRVLQINPRIEEAKQAVARLNPAP